MLLVPAPFSKNRRLRRAVRKPQEEIIRVFFAPGINTIHPAVADKSEGRGWGGKGGGLGRGWVACGLWVGPRCVACGWQVGRGDVRSWQIEMAILAAGQKKDFASEGFLEPTTNDPLAGAWQGAPRSAKTNLFLLRGSAVFFDFTLPWAAGEGGESARGSVGPSNQFNISHNNH